MYSVLITGGNGFIGTRLVDRLNDLDLKISILDNKKSLDPVQSNIDFITCDLTNRDDLQEKLSKIGPVDCLIHLAAKIEVLADHTKSRELFEVNVMGLINLFSFIEPPKKIIYASSVSVYGVPSSKIVNELHKTTPTSYYGISKLTGENYLNVFAANNKVNLIILRFTQLFGRGIHPNSIVEGFIENARNNVPLKITGEPDLERDYLHVDDAVQAILDSIAYEGNGTFNIGSGAGIRVDKLAEIVKKKVNSGVEIIRQFQNSSYSLIFDISHAAESLGFKTKQDLENTISDYAQDAGTNSSD